MKDLSNLTDEASLFDNLEEEVMIMQGSSENIKITFQEDLKLADLLMRSINNQTSSYKIKYDKLVKNYQK